MYKSINVAICIFIFASGGAISLCYCQGNGSIDSATVRVERSFGLDEVEARFLVSVLPEVLDARNDGWKILWGKGQLKDMNKSEYHFVWVGIESEAPSNRIGIYAVHRYSGEICGFPSFTYLEEENLALVRAILSRFGRISDINREELEKTQILFSPGDGVFCQFK